MLKKIAAVVLICALELALLCLMRPPAPSGEDVVALNAAVQSLRNSGDVSGADGFDYALLAEDGSVLQRSSTDVPADPLAAAAAGCLVLPFRVGGSQQTVILQRQEPAAASEGRMFWLAAAAIVLSGVLMTLYAWRLDRRILRPFRDIRRTAEEIARGRLDMPLQMDRGGVFGPFTESFDIMRSELQRAQAAEAKASADKKELISKLSHDLRTPVASIQAVSELGALTADGASKRRFEQIGSKAVQLNVLASNLLSASLEEQTELTVSLHPVPAAEVRRLLEGADYQHWLQLSALPDCTVMADPVRLQQIFDNIFANAYKYGASPVQAAGFLQDGELFLELEDAGSGVQADEVSSLRLRCFRGSNAAETAGAGLGLYICDQLLRIMGGELLVRNGERGLQITVILPLAHPGQPAGAAAE